jgi:hypothetical protein
MIKPYPAPGGDMIPIPGYMGGLIMPRLVDLAEERFSGLELPHDELGGAYQEVVGRADAEGGDGELLLVLFLCQALRSHPMLSSYLADAGVAISRQVPDAIVVPFGKHSYALVLLDQPRRREVADMTLTPGVVGRLALDPDRRFEPDAAPWLDWLRHRGSWGSDIRPRDLESALVSVANKLTLGMLVARQPRWRPLAAQVQDSGTLLGSIGIVGTDALGNSVATTASHVVSGCDDVEVDGITCAVLADKPEVDMAVLDIGTTALAVATPTGIRTDAPGVRNPVIFDGAATPMRSTRISGVDPSVVAPTQRFASRVYTDPDAADGDSGCALLDADDKLIGFCSELTPIPSDFEAATWIWADQALTRSGVLI